MMRKSNKGKLVAWVLTIAMVFGLLVVPGGRAKADTGTDPAQIGTTSSDVTVTLEVSNHDGDYYQYTVAVSNSSSETVSDWLVVVPVSGISGSTDWNGDWARVKWSYSTEYMYITSRTGETIPSGGFLGGESYKIQYTGSAGLSISQAKVYYKNGSSSTGAFDTVLESVTKPSGGGGGNVEDFTGDLTYALPSECVDDAETTPFAEHGKLHVDMTTKKLTDQNGNPFQLRGLSTHGINWADVGYPYVNFSSFKNARDVMNANAIRLAMYTTEYYGYADKGNCKEKTQDYVQKDLKYRVDKGVKCATALGMYVIVDWHVLKDMNPQLHKETAKEYFRYVSELYKGYDNILYEICNEPNNAPSAGPDWTDIKSYAEEIIPIIRENDPDAIIIVGTPTWSQEVDKPAADPIRDINGSLMDNVMYTIHFYADTHGSTYRDVVKNAEGQIPIFCTEFGMCNSEGAGTNNFSEATAWLDYFDQACISYFVWSMSIKETASLFISGGGDNWTAANLSESGQWIKTQYDARKNKNNVSPSAAGLKASAVSMTGIYGDDISKATEITNDDTATATNISANMKKTDSPFMVTAPANDSIDVGDKENITVSLKPGLPVGTYKDTLVISYKTDTQKSINVSVTATVGKRDITVTADDAEKIYGAANPEFTYTVTSGSLVGTDTLIGIVCDTEATATSDVGEYDITVTADNNANYNITTGSGKLTINKKPITTVELPSGSTIKTTQALGASVLSGGGSIYGTYAWSNPAATPERGSYTGDVILTLSDNAKKNYSFDGVTGYSSVTGTITQSVTITVMRGDLPNITFPVAAGSVEYGQKLSDVVLDSSLASTDLGTFEWKYPNTELTTVGANLCDMIFKWSDEAKTQYNIEDTDPEITLTGKVSVTVKKQKVLAEDPYTVDISKLSGTEAAEYVDSLRESSDAAPTVTYDSASKTLTLTKVSKAYTITGNNPGLTVKAGQDVGKVTLKNTTVAGVTGKGDVVVESGTAVVGGTLTADKLSVTGGSLECKNGMNIASNITVTDGNVTANSMACGGDISITGGTVKASSISADGKIIVDIDKANIVDISEEIFSKPPVNEKGEEIKIDKKPQEQTSGDGTENASGNAQTSTNTSDSGNKQSSTDKDESGDKEFVKATSIRLYAKVKGAADVPISSVYKLAVKKKMELKVEFRDSVAANFYIVANASGSGKNDEPGITFTSSKPAVATVSDIGIITAKKAGTTTITVKTSDGLSKSFKLQVMSKPVTKVKITGAKASMKVKGNMKLKAVISPNKKVASNNVCWKSSNKKIAIVDSTGRVRALKKGTVKITAAMTDGSGKKDTVKIKVK